MSDYIWDLMFHYCRVLLDITVGMTIVMIMLGLVSAQLKNKSVRSAVFTCLLVMYTGIIMYFTLFLRTPDSTATKLVTSVFRISRYLFLFVYELCHGTLLGELPKYNGKIYTTDLALNLVYEGCLNILLFLPVGYLLPFAVRGVRAKQAIAFGVALVIFVEITQLLTNRGAFDVDDLLHNTLGVAIGYWISTVVRKWFDLKLNGEKG